MDLETVAQVIGFPSDQWHTHCHEISLAMVKKGVVEGRVARGGCSGIRGQHSWIIAGNDCYASDARIVDPTLWTYRDDVSEIWEGSYAQGWHSPHGQGSIWEYGRPPHPTGEIITLDSEGFSSFANTFLEMMGPLDYRGWAALLNSPVEGWPAAEIIDRCEDHPKLRALSPIDVVGMLTDRNPQGLYR